MKFLYPSNISTAAKCLDQYDKDWYKKIDIFTLDMGRYDRCILGQVLKLPNDGDIWMSKTQELFPDIKISDRIFGSSAKEQEWIKEINIRKDNNKVKFMNLVEAFQAVYDGKKVKHKVWAGLQYIHLKNGEIVFNNNVPFRFSLLNDTTSNPVPSKNDWEVVNIQVRLKDLKPLEEFKIRDTIYILLYNNESRHLSGYMTKEDYNKSFNEEKVKMFTDSMNSLVEKV